MLSLNLTHDHYHNDQRKNSSWNWYELASITKTYLIKIEPVKGKVYLLNQKKLKKPFCQLYAISSKSYMAYENILINKMKGDILKCHKQLFIIPWPDVLLRAN